MYTTAESLIAIAEIVYEPTPQPSDDRLVVTGGRHQQRALEAPQALGDEDAELHEPA